MRSAAFLPPLLLALACREILVGNPGDSAGTETVPRDSDDTAPPALLPCEPQPLVDSPYFLEGSEVSLAFQCGSGKERAGYDAEIVALPAGVVWDPEAWSLTWQTDLDDGGRHDFMIEVRSRVASDSPDIMPETAIATVWVADAKDDPGNIPVDPAIYTEEWGLPVLHLGTRSGIDHEYEPAEVVFMGHTYEAQVKSHGAASLGYPKQSLTFEFPKEQIELDPYGLGSKRHLILLSTFDDNSYVRQKLAYDTWQAIATYWGVERLAPRTFFTVLYLDGAYWGLFVGVDRVDDELARQQGLNGEGNIYKSYDHDANFYRWDASGRSKSVLYDGYEKKEGEPAGDYSDLEDLVAFAADSSDLTFREQADDWIRVDEFMDWFLFVCYTASDDSGGKNAYLYDDPAAFEFRYAPWDFNHSFGQNWYTAREAVETYNDFTWANGIFKHFQDDEVLSEEMWRRQADLMTDGPLRWAWYEQTLDAYYALIEPSAARDWDMWEAEYRSYGGWASARNNEGDWTSYQQEKGYVYAWMQGRDQVFRARFP